MKCMPIPVITETAKIEIEVLKKDLEAIPAKHPTDSRQKCTQE
jgi:hypothetical protein